MSDVAEVKEAIERWDAATGLERKRLAVTLLDAARRWLCAEMGHDWYRPVTAPPDVCQRCGLEEDHG